MAFRWLALGLTVLTVAIGISIGCSGSIGGSRETTGEWEEPLQEQIGPSLATEPDIAVNPTNPYNIAASMAGVTAVSDDWGATFQTGPILPNAPDGGNDGNNGDVAIAFDSQGRLFAEHLKVYPTHSDVIVNQIDPTSAAVTFTANVTALLNSQGGLGLQRMGDDRSWIAADTNSGSPYKDNLYIVWGNDDSPQGMEQAAYSTDQGRTWHLSKATDQAADAGQDLSLASESQAWQDHVAVASTGDVYIAYHTQPGHTNGVPDGTSGGVVLLRSVDGGKTFSHRTQVFAPGTADVPWNDQLLVGRHIPHCTDLTVGSAMPWIVLDPVNPQNVAIVAADDVNNADIDASPQINTYIKRSTDFGAHFGAATRVNAALPVGTQAFFPTAATDRLSNCLAVMWWDNRKKILVEGGTDYQLDTLIRGSTDNGATFGPEITISDTALNDWGAGSRDQYEGGATATRRIGEYNGLYVANGVAYAAWTGNVANGSSQVMFDTARVCNVPSEPPLTGNFAAARQDANITTVLSAGNDGAIYDRWTTQGSPWNVGVTAAGPGTMPPGGSIAFLANGSTELDAFFVDSNGALREMTETSDSAWQLVTTPILPNGTAPPGAGVAAGLLSGTTRFVAVVSDSGTVTEVHAAVGGTTWTSRAITGSSFGAAGQKLAFGNQGSGQLDLFLVTGDKVLKGTGINSVSGPWSTPLNLSSGPVAPPGANIATVMQGSTQLDVLFVGYSGDGGSSSGVVEAAWSTQIAGLWSAFFAPIPLTTTSSYAPPGAGISAAPWGTDQVDVFYVDNTGALSAVWVQISTGTWLGPAPLSPPDYASPGTATAAASQYGTNVLDFFAAGKAGLIATASVGAGWTPTVPLP